MAKLQGITGGLSGKMGSAVFRQRGGQTIATQYQPIVKNPNSVGQQAQRARFKLMSQLAAIMAPGFGTMSVTKRASKGKPSQRNAFTQLNFPLVEITSDDQEMTAKIPMEQVKLTSSFRNLPPLSLGYGQGSITIDMEGISADVATVRFVVIGYTGEGTKQAVIHSITDVPVRDGVIETSLVAVSGNYTVLAYGLIPSESAAVNIDLDNIHTPADANFISAVALDAMVSAGQIAETMTVGANIIASA